MKLAAIIACLVLWFINFIIYFIRSRKLPAIEVTRNRYKLSLPTRIFRYIMIPIYLAAMSHIFIQPLLIDNLEYHMVQIIIGSIIGVSGILLLYSSIKALGENYMPCYDGVLPEKRVIEGPYKFLKHPIYISNLLQFIAVIIIMPGPIIFILFALILWIYYYTIRDENGSLNHYFPDKEQSDMA